MSDLCMLDSGSLTYHEMMSVTRILSIVGDNENGTQATRIYLEVDDYVTVGHLDQEIM